MYKNIIKKIIVTALSICVSACDFFDKDNIPQPQPLVNFIPKVQPRLLWSTDVGSGSNGEYLKLRPAVTASAIFIGNHNGRVVAVEKATGKHLWETNTGLTITTPPGVGNDSVVVGSHNGDVIALRQNDGAIRWRVSVPGEILAQPAVHDLVIIKTIDGFVRALSLADGHELWAYQQMEPTLILRGASAPIIQDNALFVGFANGTLSKFNVHSGQTLWTQTIALPQGAFSIQRMIDIDADPIIYDHHVYAATYQGKIASLDWSTGQVLWSQDISSYTGMVAENRSLYVSDAKSYVWAFDANSDIVRWRQAKLEARGVTAPAIMNNHYVVVGDAQGYVHWLEKNDGRFVARVEVGKPIYAAPIVDVNVLYIFTSNGKLFAYTL